MRYEEHIQEMLRTEKSKMTPVNDRLLHGVVGLCTETGELVECASKGADMDRTNFLEELGDFMWYVSLCVDSLGLTYADVLAHATVCEVVPKAYGGYIDNLVIISSSMLDQLKCAIFYNREIDVKATGAFLGALLANVTRIITTINSSIEEVLDMNARKLRVRYADGYSDEEANKRNINAERTALEEGGR